MTYRIIKAEIERSRGENNHLAFTTEVENSLNDGWNLAGGVYATLDQNGRTTLYQALSHLTR